MGLPMEVSCGHKVVRLMFIVFNVIFMVIGLGLIIAGSYGVVRAKSADFNELLDALPTNAQTEETVKEVRIALMGVAGVIVTIGLITMIISSCGWIGACKQNTCLLFTFSITMVIIVLLEFILGITILVIANKLNDPDSTERKSWVDTMIKNDPEKTFAAALGLAQAEGECCGITGPNDYTSEAGLNRTSVPKSCFPEEDASLSPFTIGCYDAYKDAIMSISKSVGAVAITFCVIEIFGIIISCYLAFTMRKASHYEQH